MPNLSPHVQELAGEIVAVRRDLHRYPEVGFQEVRTSGIVARHLKDYGYEVRTGLGQTGVTGFLKGGKPGKTVLLRVDMDALPVHEQVHVEWKSQTPGVMHA